MNDNVLTPSTCSRRQLLHGSAGLAGLVALAGPAAARPEGPDAGPSAAEPPLDSVAFRRAVEAGDLERVRWFLDRSRAHVHARRRPQRAAEGRLERAPRRRRPRQRLSGACRRAQGRPRRRPGRPRQDAARPGAGERPRRGGGAAAPPPHDPARLPHVAVRLRRRRRAVPDGGLAEDPRRIHEHGAHDFYLGWYPSIGGGSVEAAELLGLRRGHDGTGPQGRGGGDVPDLRPGCGRACGGHGEAGAWDVLGLVSPSRTSQAAKGSTRRARDVKRKPAGAR
jgi:hypothetical protein